MLPLVLLVLVGCFTSETEAFMSSGNASSSGLSGRVFSKSDVGTIPDVPLEARVLAIPYESIGPLLTEFGVDSGSASDPARLGLPLSDVLFEEHVAAHTRSASDGAYALDIEPGRYWVCLADIGGGGAETPAYLNGCLDVTIPEGEARTQNIYWGEAGVTDQ